MLFFRRGYATGVCSVSRLELVFLGLDEKAIYRDVLFELTSVGDLRHHPPLQIPSPSMAKREPTWTASSRYTNPIRTRAQAAVDHCRPSSHHDFPNSYTGCPLLTTSGLSGGSMPFVDQCCSLSTEVTAGPAGYLIPSDTGTEFAYAQGFPPGRVCSNIINGLLQTHNP